MVVGAAEGRTAIAETAVNLPLLAPGLAEPLPRGLRGSGRAEARDGAKKPGGEPEDIGTRLALGPACELDDVGRRGVVHLRIGEELFELGGGHRQQHRDEADRTHGKRQPLANDRIDNLS